MASASIEIELEDAMSNVGVDLSGSMLSKCVAIAKNHQLSANQMATSWEAHSLNCNVDRLDAHTFASYRASLLKGCKLESTSAIGAVVLRPAMGKRSIKLETDNEDGSKNPSKRQRNAEPLSPSSSNDGTKTPTKDNTSGASSSTSNPAVLVTPPKSKPSAPPINRFENRKNGGQIVTTYNPHNLPALTTSTPENTRSCTVSQPKSFPHITRTYRHMNDTDRATALDQQLTAMQRSMLESYSIPTDESNDQQPLPSEHTAPPTPELEATGVPRQSQQTNIGRICNEAHSGKINPTSLLLEGDRLHSNGARIAIDVAKKDGLPYSLFPGQLVAIEGMNATGRKMTVERVRTGLPPAPRAETVGASGDGCRLMIATGPYTTGADLKYSPLLDLLDVVSGERPEVVLLTGPFVDLTHPLLEDGEEVVLEYTEEDGVKGVKRHVTYETFFAAKVAQELEDLYERTPGLGTQFVLVPSMEDAIAEHVYPQPPFEDTIPGGSQIPQFPETEDIPYGSLCLDTIDTAGGRSPSTAQKHPRIHLVSNPSTIQINNTTIGITSTDALLHLSTEEINANLPAGSRLTRLAEHFLQQRSYYPMHPPPAGFGMNVDVTKRGAYSIPVRPDILVLPSKLATFAKDVEGGTLVVNPGRLVRGTVGGTYAMVDLHPVGDGEMGEGDGGGVKDRARVEIRKI